MSPSRPSRSRRTVTGEILGRWVIALVLVPVGLPVILLAGGHVTAGLLIWAIAVMTMVAIVRGARR